MWKGILNETPVRTALASSPTSRSSSGAPTTLGPDPTQNWVTSVQRNPHSSHGSSFDAWRSLKTSPVSTAGPFTPSRTRHQQLQTQIRGSTRACGTCPPWTLTLLCPFLVLRTKSAKLHWNVRKFPSDWVWLQWPDSRTLHRVKVTWHQENCVGDAWLGKEFVCCFPMKGKNPHILLIIQRLHQTHELCFNVLLKASKNGWHTHFTLWMMQKVERCANSRAFRPTQRVSWFDVRNLLLVPARLELRVRLTVPDPGCVKKWRPGEWSCVKRSNACFTLKALKFTRGASQVCVSRVRAVSSVGVKLCGEAQCGLTLQASQFTRHRLSLNKCGAGSYWIRHKIFTLDASWDGSTPGVSPVCPGVLSDRWQRQHLATCTGFQCTVEIAGSPIWENPENHALHLHPCNKQHDGHRSKLCNARWRTPASRDAWRILCQLREFQDQVSAHPEKTNLMTTAQLWQESLQNWSPWGLKSVTWNYERWSAEWHGVGEKVTTQQTARKQNVDSNFKIEALGLGSQGIELWMWSFILIGWFQLASSSSHVGFVLFCSLIRKSEPRWERSSPGFVLHLLRTESILNTSGFSDGSCGPFFFFFGGGGRRLGSGCSAAPPVQRILSHRKNREHRTKNLQPLHGSASAPRLKSKCLRQRGSHKFLQLHPAWNWRSCSQSPIQVHGSNSSGWRSS